MDLAAGLDQRWFVVPQAAVRLVLSDGAPRPLGQGLVDPVQMALPLDKASHVHDDVPGGGISFDAVPEPTVGRGPGQSGAVVGG